MARYENIRQALDDLPVFDVHSHLGAKGKWCARDIRDLIGYHWLKIELERLTGGKIEGASDVQSFMARVLPLFPAIRNTSTHYCFVGMLKALYGFEGATLTAENWEGVNEAIESAARRADQRAKVLDTGKIRKVLVARRDMPESNPGDRFVPYDYGEKTISLEADEPGDLDRIEKRIRAKVAELADAGSKALHMAFMRTERYLPDSAPDTVSALLDRKRGGASLSADEANRIHSWCLDILTDEAGKRGVVVQVFHGMARYASPVSANGALDVDPGFMRNMAILAGGHPGTTFDLFLATRQPSHESASFGRILPNLCLSGAWWHGFTPATLKMFYRDRLEMLPNTAWTAFYSDGYTVEWVIGKLHLAKHCLALVLAEMVSEGFYSEDDALRIARNLLWENPLRTYGG